ncbi:EAL domain-containing protein [Cellulomonas sp. NPDC058312]|uniref:bifunctional diguanylate cyclase/phosphodiesterase n=1 Tax=Cellulomonas sp. NPDC058312 TaxID=3346441 RepID=UPI0036EB3DA8
MPLDARRRARRRLRFILAVLIPLGLVLTLAFSALDAQQQRERIHAATRAQLAVTAESVSGRVDVQTRLAVAAARLLTPTGTTSWGDGVAEWDMHVPVLGVAEGVVAADDHSAGGATAGIGWVAASDGADPAAPVHLAPAGTITPHGVTVGGMVRSGAPSLLDGLVAGTGAPSALSAVAAALTVARDTGRPALSAVYPVDALTADSHPADTGLVARAGSAVGPEAAVVAPVYDAPAPPDDVAARQRLLLGWTVVTFRVAPLLDQVPTRPRDAIVVRDGATVLGELADGTAGTVPAAAPDRAGPGTAQTLDVPVAGRTWTLVAAPQAEPGPLAWFPLVLGLLLTGLVVGLMGSRAAAEVRAVVLAAERTRALALRTRDLESITRNTPDALARVDADGCLQFVNEAMRRAASLTEDDLGRTVKELSGRSAVMDAVRALAHHMIALGTEPGVDVDADPRRLISMSAPSGGHWYDVRAVPEPGPDGGVDSVLVVARDVTRFREAQDRLTHAATHDSLTGLPNRDLARERAVAALATSREGTALLLLDLDRFKLVNDSYGHVVGDELLQRAAGRVAADLPDRATAARLGGDEFVVLLPDVDAATAERVARRLVTAFDEPFVLRDEEFAVGCSVGVVHAEPGAMPWDELLRCADVAMYGAKAAGGSTHHWYEEHGADHARQRLTMAADLRRAVEEGEVTLVYQAEVDLITGRVEGVEALMRWTSRTRGPVSPAEFIPVAEETGLIGDLGAWALDRALGEVSAHNRRTGADLRVWVNVSPRQFAAAKDRPDLVTLVVDTLAAHDAPPSWLGIEVTESALADDARAVPMLRALRETGIGVAIDDFGTGYSSLSRLHDYPVTLLKIDQSFVQGLGGGGPVGSRAGGVVEAIVALGRSLGADVIAEGVEDEPRYTALRSLGCDLAQGYLFGRPSAFELAVRPVDVPGPALPGMVGARPPAFRTVR